MTGITITPQGVTVDGQPVPLTPIAVQWGPDGAVVSFHTTDPEVTVDGALIVVRDPTPAELDEAVRDLIRGIDAQALMVACQARMQTGPRDPYQAVLDQITEWTT